MRRSAFLLQMGAALAAGTALTILVVLPAEYNIDPTGFGAAAGLTRISAPPEVVVETRADAPPEIARLTDMPLRTDTIPLTIGGMADNFGALEYKVTLAAGEQLAYSWRSTGDLVYEFHGHTLDAGDGEPMQVMNYVAGTSRGENGTLTAPIDGIHGWYFANPSFEPVEVELTLSGFYRLEPGIIGLH
jgi:hypothetical protein